MKQFPKQKKVCNKCERIVKEDEFVLNLSFSKRKASEAGRVKKKDYVAYYTICEDCSKSVDDFIRSNFM